MPLILFNCLLPRLSGLQPALHCTEPCFLLSLPRVIVFSRGDRGTVNSCHSIIKKSITDKKLSSCGAKSFVINTFGNPTVLDRFLSLKDEIRGFNQYDLTWFDSSQNKLSTSRTSPELLHPTANSDWVVFSTFASPDSITDPFFFWVSPMFLHIFLFILAIMMFIIPHTLIIWIISSNPSTLTALLTVSWVWKPSCVPLLFFYPTISLAALMYISLILFICLRTRLSGLQPPPNCIEPYFLLPVVRYAW